MRCSVLVLVSLATSACAANGAYCQTGPKYGTQCYAEPDVRQPPGGARPPIEESPRKGEPPAQPGPRPVQW